ncbi:MAG: hypothetical protein RIM99_02010 [Cyclobacteriaceae bacterium]
MKLLTILLCLITIGLSAQSKRVTEKVDVNGQSRLKLEFAFADLIEFKSWDKNEILVQVDVEINDGEHNDIFSLNSSKTTSTVYIEMDKDMWNKVDRDWRRRNNTWRSEINYAVFLPEGIEVEANTISGDYEFEYFGSVMRLKTISGAIDMTVPLNEGLDFRAKTISGEVYSDIEIKFPYGKEGLRQIVGQKVYGRISDGGKELSFETISGDIYLRKK